MTFRYTENELREIFEDALCAFDECLDSGIRKDNTLLRFFLPEEGKTVYENFCSKHFPKYLRENYDLDGYFESFAAQAFVGEDDVNGIMFRRDLDFPPHEIFFLFLHELSHIFCTRNEIEGGHFFDRYCMGSGIEDGMMNAGYAIWREAIADIMADSIKSEYASQRLADVKSEVMRMYRMLSIENPDSKKQMSLIIAYIMISGEVAGTETWDTAEKAIRKIIRFDNELIYVILRMIFANLHDSPFWCITPDYISGLGEVYLALLAHKRMETLMM